MCSHGRLRPPAPLRARRGRRHAGGAAAGSGRAGPPRFCAMAGAMRARSRRADVVGGADALAGEPVGLLRQCEETAALPASLERLGVMTLGDLTALPRAAVADRFGPPGLRAHDL